LSKLGAAQKLFDDQQTKVLVVICVQYFSFYLQNIDAMIRAFCITLKNVAVRGDASFLTYCKIILIPSISDVILSVMFLTIPSNFLPCI